MPRTSIVVCTQGLRRAFFCLLAALFGCGPLTQLSDNPLNEPVYSQELALNSDGYANRPYAQGLYFGAGLNIITEEPLTAANCLQRDAKGDYAFFMSRVPQRTEYSYEIVQSKEQLRDHLRINARLQLDIAAISGHLSGEYIDQMDTTSDSVYAVIKLDRLFREFSMRNPQFEPAAVELFERPDPEPFRRACGDLFVNVITTGGMFYGLLEVHAKSLADKTKIAAELRAELKAIKLTVEGSLDLEDSKIDEKFDIKIHFVSEGAAGEMGMANSFASFAQNFNTFKTNLERSDAETGKILDDPNIDLTSEQAQKAMKVAVTRGIQVKFEPYGSLDPAHMQGGDQKRDAEIMDEYCDLTRNYNTIIEQIEIRQLRPHAYVSATSNAIQQRLAELKKNVEEYKRKVRPLARRCADTTNRECVDVRQIDTLKAQGLVPPNDLFESLPDPKPLYPRTCDEIQDNFTILEEINTLFVGGDRFSPYRALCYGFHFQPVGGRSFPEEYLLLRATSALGENPRFNYSKYIGYPENGVAGAAQTETLITVYGALRVNDFTYGLSVFPTQGAYAESLGKAVDHGQTFTQAIWGTSRSCSATVQAAANVDLSGTPFKLAFDQTFETDSDQYMTIEEPMNWVQAVDYAENRLGGSILSLYGDAENEKFRRVLSENLLSSSWLGLMHDPSVGRDFEWYPYRNFAYRNWQETPRLEGAEDLACAFMESFNGKWRHTDCFQTRKPFVVEFKKMVGAALEAEVPTVCELYCYYQPNPTDCDACKSLHRRQVFDLSIGSKMPGTCGAFGSLGEVELVYDRKIAMKDPELRPYFEEYKE